MKSTKPMRLSINLVAATALSTPLLAKAEPEAGKPTAKGPRKPQTPQELREARAFAASQGDTRRGGQQYPMSPRAMQYAGQHKDKGTPKGHPFKPR